MASAEFKAEISSLSFSVDPYSQKACFFHARGMGSGLFLIPRGCLSSLQNYWADRV